MDDEDDERAEATESEAVDEDAGDDEWDTAEGEDHERYARGLECCAEHGHLACAEALGGASECDLGCDAHGGDESHSGGRGGGCEAVFSEVLPELCKDALVGEGGGDETDEG